MNQMQYHQIPRLKTQSVATRERMKLAEKCQTSEAKTTQMPPNLLFYTNLWILVSLVITQCQLLPHTIDPPFDINQILVS